MIQIALYKGPPSDILHWIGHLSTCAWTGSKYSHAELVIDGICYSSSSRDGGVRKKVIDLNSGKWDLINVIADKQYALDWFSKHEGCKYDWANIARFVIPVVHEDKNKFVCFETVGYMLGIKDAYKLTANDLLKLEVK